MNCDTDDNWPIIYQRHLARHHSEPEDKCRDLAFEDTAESFARNHRIPLLEARERLKRVLPFVKVSGA